MPRQGQVLQQPDRQIRGKDVLPEARVEELGGNHRGPLRQQRRQGVVRERDAWEPQRPIAPTTTTAA
eukprot:8623842-Heterocapsa_arctica.AAC.1